MRELAMRNAGPPPVHGERKKPKKPAEDALFVQHLLLAKVDTVGMMEQG